MQVRRNVVVRAVVTPNLKERFIRELQASLDRISAEQRELEARTRRYLLQSPTAEMASAIRQQVEIESRRYEVAKREIQDRMQEVERWREGDRVYYDTLEGVVELKVGDSLEEKLEGAEIVIQDGVIIDIKEP